MGTMPKAKATEPPLTASTDDHPTTKVSMRLDTAVLDALAKLAGQGGRETLDYVAWVLTDHVLELGAVQDTAEAERLRLTESLIVRAVDTARQTVQRGGFSADITLRTFRACHG